MKIQDIKFLYEYNYWANKKILAAAAKVTQEQFLGSAEFPFGGLRGTMLHIVDAEYGWRGFFETKKFSEDLNIDDFPTLSELEKKFQEEETALRAYLNHLTDEELASRKSYTTDTGVVRNRVLWHCLAHVVNHGTQHRSEAAALLTRFNASPGDLDFTVFLNDTGNF
ncbi:MAG: DinB family protein [Anaerolineales bacterium]